jgi:hypothetical protein
MVFQISRGLLALCCGLVLTLAIGCPGDDDDATGDDDSTTSDDDATGN